MATEQQYVFPERVRYLCSQRRPSEISLLPYTEINGSRTLSDDAILKIGRQFEQDGTFKRVFYEGPVDGPSAFLTAMKTPGNLPAFIYSGLEPIGVAWLNSCSGTHATAHFCLMNRASALEKLQGGRMVLDYWMSWEINDKPVFDVLIGAIPEWNAEAAKFAEGLGFKRVGVIPKMLSNRHTGEISGAVILYYAR